MTSRVRHGGLLSLIAISLALGIVAFPVSSALAHGGGGGGGHGGGMGGMGMGHMGGMGMGMGHMGMGGFGGYGYGRLGYGGYGGFGGIGFFPGYYGYGLGYGYPFLGGGYGGYGLGYGGYGGYGLGYGGYGGYGLGYGGYGGGLGYGGYPYYGGGYGYTSPYYSNAYYTTPVLGTTYSSAYVAPTGSAANTVIPGQQRYLGIDEEPIVDSGSRRGIKVTNVYPGTAAHRAGLRVGDVIYSINGYLTEQRGNLAWIIANAAPTNQLNIIVKRSSDGQERAITAQLP